MKWCIVSLNCPIWKGFLSADGLFLGSGDFCGLPIVFENGLDPDQDQQSVDQSGSKPLGTLMVTLPCTFSHLLVLSSLF